MKTIDFACYLLANMSREPLSLHQVMALLGIVAGLTTTHDMSRFYGITPSVAGGACTGLLKRGLVYNSGVGAYTLTPEGKAMAIRLMTAKIHD